MKNQWWEDKADQLQYYADVNNVKGFYDGLKAVWGPRINQPTQLKSKDGQQLYTENSEILSRWADHFNTLLNIPANISQDALDRLHNVPTASWMDEEPSYEEFEKALDAIGEGKAPGVDQIPGELLKRCGKELKNKIWQVIVGHWKAKEVPQEWKDANLVTIFKKGDRTDCGNYRGIALLSVAGKMLARILLNRLTTHVSNTIIPESQCGFRSGRTTIDMIFTLRQVQEKCIEQNKSLYVVFIDFRKAFDTVNRDALWKVLKCYGCPDRFLSLVKGFHQKMNARVCSQGEYSDPIEVKNGVKQGCVLAPTLFSIYLSAVIDDAFRDTSGGVSILTRPGPHLFDISKFKAKTKTKTVTVRELMFADDTALVAHTHDDIQRITSAFARSASSFGLQINMSKTEVLYQAAPGSLLSPEDILIDNKPLTTVTSFTYLGSTVTSTNKLDKELQIRMAKASSAFGRLSQRLWRNHNVFISMKCKFYRAIIISTLLCGIESWTLYKCQMRKLEVYIMRHLRTIMNIRWWHHISNKEILARAHFPSLHALLVQRTMRWAGHIVRMEDQRLPKQVLFSQLSSGERKIARPILRYKDTIKRGLKDLAIPTKTWYELAGNRSQWRAAIQS